MTRSDPLLTSGGSGPGIGVEDIAGFQRLKSGNVEGRRIDKVSGDKKNSHSDEIRRLNRKTEARILWHCSEGMIYCKRNKLIQLLRVGKPIFTSTIQTPFKPFNMLQRLALIVKTLPTVLHGKKAQETNEMSSKGCSNRFTAL